MDSEYAVPLYSSLKESPSPRLTLIHPKIRLFQTSIHIIISHDRGTHIKQNLISNLSYVGRELCVPPHRVFLFLLKIKKWGEKGKESGHHSVKQDSLPQILIENITSKYQGEY